jgi:hypothetical protein
MALILNGTPDGEESLENNNKTTKAATLSAA